MADHLQKWHDASTSRKISNGSSDGITAITSKLDSFRRDIKKLEENVHDIQVGCEDLRGAHLNKDCPLLEEVKSVEEFKRLKQHAEEALVHKDMESLNKIKVKRLFLKEIRQTNDYAKHIKNLMESKLRISGNDDVKINTRCSAILQNQLPPKEQDPRSFILPWSIGKLTFNALADLGESISVMPL
uniref:Reverse transcriptase domain-containing protein n=1 Tax=Tanacetum cinerariifolium TaxID=118510 RepID=A0A6L2MTC0_TANCI|nr:hypothetical protein [Tanacetum cinerariifolium]